MFNYGKLAHLQLVWGASMYIFYSVLIYMANFSFLEFRMQVKKSNVIFNLYHKVALIVVKIYFHSFFLMEFNTCSYFLLCLAVTFLFKMCSTCMCSFIHCKFNRAILFLFIYLFLHQIFHCMNT